MLMDNSDADLVPGYPLLARLLLEFFTTRVVVPIGRADKR